ncbi:SCO1/SenC family transporter protein [Legionella geestiana]|uniref:SCO1/SenC family transporter protein n=1 Tax=Legionella geestiana TaxID=45065 RepID=A0A0W0TU12_9GAMM|nr:SCO family protein [Legionella geestiana]KTC98958.1 SCO1/SenC family transporter protein [Legionella geestiana]QBS13047.1 SCO family protein [Legionella geestiana]QDQ39273.1 SCO family protein [Legionella geestiana]STX54440.1 SCO1/SenC family protein [Legionella geestiana]
MLSQKQRIKRVVLVLLMCVAGILATFYVSQMSKKKPLDSSQLYGTLLSNPRDINAFELSGTDGTPFNNASLKGRWTLLFFGFTQCGHICPTTMAELGTMYRELEKQGVTPLPRVVMISIDPARDSLKTLKHYTRAFNPHFEGARGEESAVSALAREMGIAWEAVQPRPGAQGYDIQHSGTIMLVNPNGQLQAFFTPPLVAANLAKDYALIVAS